MSVPFPDGLQPPAPERMQAMAALCRLAPYAHGPEADALFVAAMRENVAWHTEHSDFYRRLLAQSGMQASDLHSIDDCLRLPAVHANVFKQHELLSVPREQVAVHLTSSGTTGQKSQVFFDAWSIGSGQHMVRQIFQHYGWVQPEQPTNYLLFNYEPLPQMRVGTSFTANFLCSFAPANELFYALRWAGGTAHEFDVYAAIATLERYAAEGLPVRILGIPAFLHFTLQKMQALGRGPLKLAPGSFVFTAGGWKGHADQVIPPAQFRAQVTEQLGIPDELVRDGWGSVEHSVPYVTSPGHQLHAPAYSRLVVRDVRTLEPLGYDQPGFLSFVTPYLTSVPAVSVIMGDLAERRRPLEQPGEPGTDAFHILGRAGVSKNRSCAVAAAELLKAITR